MPTITYKLNVRFLAKLIIIVLVLGGGLFFLHRYQESKLTSRFKTQADNARDEGKPLSELSYLRQYIAMNPNEIESRVRYGKVLARHARKPMQVVEAYMALQNALAKDPGLPDEVRKQCVELALRPDVNLPIEARRELEQLFRNNPENSEYEALMSDSLIRTNELPAAEEFLTRAKNRSRGRIDIFLRLAWVKRERNRTNPVNDAADAVIAEMLDHPEHKQRAETWLRAANYYRAYGKPKEAEAALAQAEAIAPDNHQVVFSRAEATVMKWRDSFPYGTLPKPTPELQAALARVEKKLEELLPTLPPRDPPPEFGSADDRLFGDVVLMFRLLVKANLQAARLPEAEAHARKQIKVFKDEVLYMQYELLEVLVAAGKLDEARQIAGKLSSQNFMPALVELQLGFIDVRERKWVEASRHLERVKNELAGFPDLYRRACSLLAEIYEQTNELDRRAALAEEGVPKDPQDPTYVAAKKRLAEVRIALGRYQEAIQHLRDIADRDAAVLPVLAGLLTADIATQPQAARKWAEVEAVVAKIPAGPAQSIAQADILIAKADVPAARQKLADAAAKSPKSLEVVNKRIILEIREKDTAAAEAILTKAEADMGDVAVVRNFKIMLLAVKSAGKPDAAAGLTPLAAGLDKFTVPERVLLLRTLANTARGLQRRDLAWKWLEELAALRGDEDMDLHFARFDLALMDKDDDKLNKVLADIARITGRDSPSARLANAFANIYKADHLKNQPAERARLLVTASEMLAGLESQRKDWGKLYFAMGRAADLQNKNDAAIAHYRKAIALGERQPEMVSRLVDLLFLEKRNDEAVKLFNEVPEAQAMLGNEVEKIMLMHLGGKNYPQAEKLARDTVPDTSTDPAKLLWRVKVHAAAGNRKEAEPLLRKAVDIDPSRSDTFLAYVQLLMEMKRPEDAKRFVTTNKGRIKAEDAELSVAQAFVAVRDDAAAKAAFKDLVDKHGNSVPVLRAAAGFHYSIREYGMARPLLERLMTENLSDADRDMARRMLAITVVVGADHRTAVGALKLMGFESPSAASVIRGDEPIEELEARFAVLMAIKGRESRLACIAILKKIETKLPDIGTDKQLAWAKLSFAVGDWAEAKRRFAIAALASDSTTATRAAYAAALLRKGELDEAKRLIDAIAGAEPNTLLTADLLARHAVQSFNKPRAAEVMRAYAGKKGADVLQVARILEHIGMPEDAESYYRAAAQAAKDALPKLEYAGYLARAGKAEQSLAEFEAVWPSAPPGEALSRLCEAMMHRGQAPGTGRLPRRDAQLRKSH
jgi:cellulose synthase operon protein C